MDVDVDIEIETAEKKSKKITSSPLPVGNKDKFQACRSYIESIFDRFRNDDVTANHNNQQKRYNDFDKRAFQWR